MRTSVLRMLDRVAEPLRRRGMRRTIIAGRRVLGVLGSGTVTVDGIRLGGGIEHRSYLATLRAGTNEPATRQLFAKAAHPGATVLDIGAHIGSFTLLAGRRVGPSGRVLAVEPDPRNRRQLERNLRRNHQGDNVEVLPFALGAVNGSTTFFLHDSDPSQSGIAERDAPGEVVEVEVRRGEDVVQAPLHVIKLDVEGHEAKVLDGLRSVIDASPEITVFCELNPAALARASSSPSDLIEVLEGLGLEPKAILEGSGELVDVPDDAAIEHFVNLLCRRRSPDQRRTVE